MSQNYTVKQGDHLSGIAEQFGFADFGTIWNHGSNQDLKDQRGDPHVLFPGDQLFIPDHQVKTESAATTKVHIFQIKAKPLLLQIALKDFDHKPFANTACELELDGKIENLTTDSDGLIKTRITKAAKKGVLRVADLDLEVPVEIGYLDPVEETSGVQGRLINLGYFVASVGDPDEESLHNAIEEFQCDHGLKIDGIAGPVTQAKLKEVHGS